MPIIKQVEVTEADIKLAIEEQIKGGVALAPSKCCPIYQAIKRQDIFPNIDFMVGASIISYSTWKKLATLPESARMFIHSFDRNNLKKAEPFEFEIELIDQNESKEIKHVEEGC